MSDRGYRRPFRTSSGEVPPGAIAEAGYHRIGGIEQWVMLRGDSEANPPLIFLHGGPGMSETSFLRHFNAALEKSFTVAYWDQRGTGKSFHPDIPRSSMTVEQFIADLDEVVEYVRMRLGRPRVVILGHSWGTALGVLYAARFPQKVSAYVGSAQIGDWAAAEVLSYSFALSEARRLKDWRMLKRLHRIGPPPHTPDRLMIERTCLQRMDGQMEPRALWNVGRVMFGGPESSLADVPNFVRGFRFSLDAMWREVSTLNLASLAPVLQMPVFFFLGRRDHWVPPETSVHYFNMLAAPSKTLVWFEQSGHEMFIDEPGRFNREMAHVAALVREGQVADAMIGA